MSIQQRQRHAVYGYVRLNHKESNIAEDVINIIHDYIDYLIRFGSKILSLSDQIKLLDLLHDRLAKQEEYECFKTINFKLLFRASDHDYSANIFHDLCDNKGPTLTIVHTNHGHIFGIYITKSFSANYDTEESKDPQAFMFQIVPNVRYYGLKSYPSYDPKKRIYNGGANAVWKGDRFQYSISFGAGPDLWINKGVTQNTGSGCRNGTTFDFKATQLSGAPWNWDRDTCSFEVMEYETFELECNTYYYKYT